jgi:hypothetical protein
MNTDAYLEVRQKMRQSGRAYFEGFSSRDFEGLSPQEREEIIGVLKERAASNDGVAFAALQELLSRDEILIFINDLLQRAVSLDRLFLAQIQVALFTRTANEQAWQSLLRILTTGDSVARHWILNKLKIESLCQQHIHQLSLLLPEMIIKERDVTLLISLIAQFLKIERFIPKSSEYIKYARRLQSPNPNERRAALIELGARTEV